MLNFKQSRKKMLFVYIFTALVVAVFAPDRAMSQVVLNPNPSRVVGHAQLSQNNVNPNLVEGRELFAPQGIVVDAAANPPILYVADTFNNRVLAWRNAAQFGNGAAADLVIGQKDKYSTVAAIPGSTSSVGLNLPTGLVVRNGNLYVVDGGNNRILRFPSPFSQTEQFPDLVIGQPSMNERAANQGYSAPTEKTLALAGYRAALTFDATGNLWVVDAGNSRVLRYPSGALNANGPAADLVLGQADFVSAPARITDTVENRKIKDRLYIPAGLAFDSAGRLYVSDALNRVVVFAPPFFSGMLARRVMGVVIPAKQGEKPIPQATYDRTMMVDPEGIFFLDGVTPAVIDTQSNRILVFDRFEQWPEENTTFSPAAKAVVGQNGDFANRKLNNGQAQPNAGTLYQPVAAVISGNELFVADAGNNRIVVLPQSGRGFFDPARRVLGQDGFQFNSPNLIEGREFRFSIQTSRGLVADAGIVVDNTSDTPRLYVADTYNNRVLGFKDARKVRPGDRADVVLGQPDMLTGMCNYPANDPQKPDEKSLCQPTGLLVDRDGNLWVADTGNGRVLRFPNPFAHQATLPRADLVIGQASFTTKITDPTARTMASPYGIAMVGDDGLLVSDVEHNRALFFPRVNGSFSTGMAATKVFGQPNFISSKASAEDSGMNAPRHVSADTDGRPYVADTGNNRVLIFDAIQELPSANARSAAVLAASAPRSVYVSPGTGEIWVTDTNSGRSLRFPRFDQLAFNGFASNTSIAGVAPMAVTQDRTGNLYVCDASNRVSVHYRSLYAVNAGNLIPNRALAPSMVASIYPRGGIFGDETQSHDQRPTPLPLPTELGDVQVLVNDQPAPLFFVSPSQINLLVPTTAPISGSAEFQVVRRSTGEILASAPIPMNVAAPALFTVSGLGSGQAVAVNEDGTANAATNPAPRRSVISLFGTGQGPVESGPPDGEAAQGDVSTEDKPRVWIGTCFLDQAECMDGNPTQLLYSGLAPGQVGVWQIKVRIPDGTVPGNAVPVFVIYKSMASAQAPRGMTTIAVK